MRGAVCTLALHQLLRDKNRFCGDTHLGVLGRVGQCQVANHRHIVPHVHVIIDRCLQTPQQRHTRVNTRSDRQHSPTQLLYVSPTATQPAGACTSTPPRAPGPCQLLQRGCGSWHRTGSHPAAAPASSGSPACCVVWAEETSLCQWGCNKRMLLLVQAAPQQLHTCLDHSFELELSQRRGSALICCHCCCCCCAQKLRCFCIRVWCCEEARTAWCDSFC